MARRLWSTTRTPRRGASRFQRCHGRRDRRLGLGVGRPPGDRFGTQPALLTTQGGGNGVAPLGIADPSIDDNVTARFVVFVLTTVMRTASTRVVMLCEAPLSVRFTWYWNDDPLTCATELSEHPPGSVTVSVVITVRVGSVTAVQAPGRPG